MKIPKNYIPGTNPYKSLPKKPIIESKKLSKKQEQINAEIMNSQERILKLYMRRLQKKDQIILQNFIMEGHKVGSKIFNNLSRILKEIITIMNIESLKVLLRNTKNPIKKLYIKFSTWTLNKLLKSINSSNITQDKQTSKKNVKK
ncbi:MULTISPECIES: hypothetical protein [Borrelia]|uniref:Uncharacterized protein n=2 Tax=Borrelia turicatae TaxID=142 RepID=A0A172XBV5_BORTU|nr:MULTISPECIES: hypothetical protein [Borrelia]AAX17849.1 hypothetical protein BT0525 [Borrelia turicatae 91E135]ANF33987.1 hypothetical protein A7978_02605 [Borrelia turicatae]UPA12186.1 hypothetical protein bvRMA01_000522 [Borrelia venezuelensis]UPA13358.1 hypothetical protein bt91E135_000519 [Borrelia turicatae 91E135]UPA14843.1 hypothetical protein btBTE5EL_000520 [Borrelia turicatae]